MRDSSCAPSSHRYACGAARRSSARARRDAQSSIGVQTGTPRHHPQARGKERCAECENAREAQSRRGRRFARHYATPPYARRATLMPPRDHSVVRRHQQCLRVHVLHELPIEIKITADITHCRRRLCHHTTIMPPASRPAILISLCRTRLYHANNAGYFLHYLPLRCAFTASRWRDSFKDVAQAFVTPGTETG